MLVVSRCKTPRRCIAGDTQKAAGTQKSKTYVNHGSHASARVKAYFCSSMHVCLSFPIAFRLLDIMQIYVKKTYQFKTVCKDDVSREV